MPYVLAIVILILAVGVIGFALEERKRRSKVETAARIFEDLVRLHLKVGALTGMAKSHFQICHCRKIGASHFYQTGMEGLYRPRRQPPWSTMIMLTDGSS